MDLATFLQILRRKWWLILLLVVVASGILAFRLSAAEPIYMAQVKLQITAPQPEGVEIFEQYRSISLRDDIAIARNNFLEILKSPDVYQRTGQTLGFPNTEYEIETSIPQDSDFLYVSVEHGDPVLAAEIVNTHVEVALARFGEVRSKPASATKAILTEQLAITSEKYREAENALAKFQIEHNIADPETEMASLQQVIQQLQIERSRQELQEPTTAQVRSMEELLATLKLDRERAYVDDDQERVERLDQVIRNYEVELAALRTRIDSVQQIDDAIARYRQQLQDLIVLRPEYKTLQENLRQTQEEHRMLLDKYKEATLKESIGQSVSFIQIIDTGKVPAEPVSTRFKPLLILTVVGSMGLGVLLAIAIESLEASAVQSRQKRRPTGMAVGGRS